MKKNLLNIILIVLVLTNTVLTGILVFVILKPMQDTGRLVDKICKVLDLELEADKNDIDISDIPIEELEYFNLDEKLTVPLKISSDGVQHYAQIYPSIALYIKHDDYAKYNENLVNQKAVITQHIQDVIQQYTYSEMLSNPEIIRREATKDLQELYDSEFIVEVIFDKTTLQ